MDTFFSFVPCTKSSTARHAAGGSSQIALPYGLAFKPWNRKIHSWSSLRRTHEVTSTLTPVTHAGVRSMKEHAVEQVSKLSEFRAIPYHEDRGVHRVQALLRPEEGFRVWLLPPRVSSRYSSRMQRKEPDTILKLRRRARGSFDRQAAFPHSPDPTIETSRTLDPPTVP